MSLCYNCGGQHDSASCFYPSYLERCANCLVMSLDGSGHGHTCRASNLSHQREHIYAEVPIPIFKMKFCDPKGLLHVFDRKSGLFTPVKHEPLKIHAHAINGVFEVKKSGNGESVLSFEGTKLHRFSLAIGFFTEGAWRLRCRLVVTLQDGVLCFPLHTTFNNRGGIYNMPPEFDFNTALVLGVGTTSKTSLVKLKIFANETGFMNSDSDNFNGYFGQFVWNSDNDTVDIGSTLKPTSSVYFSHMLYDVGINKSQQHFIVINI